MLKVSNLEQWSLNEEGLKVIEYDAIIKRNKKPSDEERRMKQTRKAASKECVIKQWNEAGNLPGPVSKTLCNYQTCDASQ